tara:strand:+ start:676 stop:1224 length:549 start_codon:yes stop_codon:yes gene_type:complete
METSFLITKDNKWIKYFIYLYAAIFINLSLINNAKASESQLSYEIPDHAIKFHDLAHSPKKKLTLLTYSKLFLRFDSSLQQGIDKNRIKEKSYRKYKENNNFLFISDDKAGHELNNYEIKYAKENFKKNMKKWILEISNLNKNKFNTQKKHSNNYFTSKPTWDYSFNVSPKKLKIKMAKDLQ